MLLIRRIEITNFVCFDQIEIEPSRSSEKPLTVIRAENGSGKTTLLRAIRWGMYGEKGLPGNQSHFSLHPAGWQPDASGIETSVAILFETDGSSRNHPEGEPRNTVYELRRSVTTVAKQPSRQGEPDFRRMSEEAQLLIQEPDGSWLPYEPGVDRVIEELLPWALQDFFVMDADEAADYVGGSENKVLDRRAVIAKTSFAVGALLGLDVFEKATGRVRTISNEFGRAATKAAGSRELSEKQAELDQLRGKVATLEENLENNRHDKADVEDRLTRARGRLEALIGSLGAHDQLKERLKENETQRKLADNERRKAAGALSTELAAIELMASLAAREVTDVRDVLQPLYDDGSIPIRHLVFVQSLLEKGTCVCGQDLTSQSEHRQHVQHIVEQSSGKEEKANYLAQVLHAANMLHRHKEGEEWEIRCAEHGRAISDLEVALDDLVQVKRDINAKLDAIDNENVERTRGEIDMLEGQSARIERELVSDQRSLEHDRKSIHQLEGIIRSGQRRQQQARDLETYQETANALVHILEQAYGRIREDQVRELSSEMNDLFAKMAANVVDDEEVEEDRHKATLRMIAKVGLRPLEGAPGEYEIFALNGRGRSMPPTEINGASRRILALSFVLGLCKVSRTSAPLVADSLLNFMSGSVRTNTLRITAETASQPILLLTGSDLESQSEVQLAARYAGAMYTLTGQWQHTAHGGDVVNQTDARQVSLLCQCGPRAFCNVCERQGQADGSRTAQLQPVPAKTCKLRHLATLETVDFTPARRLYRQQVLTWGTGAWVACARAEAFHSPARTLSCSDRAR